MKCIAHISDLHFGREDKTVAAGLIRDLNNLESAVVVNSGDFTQRARRRQFVAAAAYVSQITAPKIMVPGNHDIPLYDVARRFLSPLGRYKRYLTRDMFPMYVDEEVAVLGVNTARSATWKSGRISSEQVLEIERILGSLPPRLFKVLVTHHPFIPPPGDEEAGVDLVGGAVRALEVISRCGVDLLLAGHLHHGYAGDVKTFYPAAGKSVIAAQAGTAISHRMRDEPNGYNLIRLSGSRIEIEVRGWNGEAFAPLQQANYTLEGEIWKRDE